MQEILDRSREMLGSYVPNLLAALAILIVGWLVALLFAAMTRSVLKRVSVDNRLLELAAGPERAAKGQAERWVSSAVYYLVMLLVLVAFLQALGLTLTTEPLNQLLNQVFVFVPKLAGALLLLVLAWLVASLVRFIVTRGLGAARIDEKLGDRAGVAEPGIRLTRTLGDALYWLVFLFFLPAVLDTLALQGLLEPIQALLQKVLGFLPNVVTAVLIVLIGWFAARIVQRVVTNLVSAAGVDRLGERAGVTAVLGAHGLSRLLGIIVYVLILIPVLIAALEALALDAISQPASTMLGTILSAIPAVFAAAVVVGLAYVVARIVSGLVSNLLESAGFDALFLRLGLPAAGSDNRTPSAIVGYLILAGIMLFAVTEACSVLGFEELAVLMAQLTVFAASVLMGLLILAIGLFLANLAANAVRSSGARHAATLATVARMAIVVLAGTMALERMGLASEIIELTFGLVLGAVAVAAAIAFGVAGRETAGRVLRRWGGTG